MIQPQMPIIVKVTVLRQISHGQAINKLATQFATMVAGGPKFKAENRVRSVLISGHICFNAQAAISRHVPNAKLSYGPECRAIKQLRMQGRVEVREFQAQSIVMTTTITCE